MIGSGEVSLFIAFMAGIFSFFSPCILPVIPPYLLFISGLTLKEYNNTENRTEARKKIFMNSLFFVFGFFVVFIAFGGLASYFGKLFVSLKPFIRVFGGTLIVFFGLYLLGLFNLKGLNIERKINLKIKPSGYLGSFLVGITFGASWIPCIGPILGSILILAASSETFYSGFLLLVVYSLGLAIPFLLAAFFIDPALQYIKKAGKYLRYFEILSGAALIIIGFLLLTDYFNALSYLMVR